MCATAPKALYRISFSHFHLTFSAFNAIEEPCVRNPADCADACKALKVCVCACVCVRA